LGNHALGGEALFKRGAHLAAVERIEASDRA